MKLLFFLNKLKLSIQKQITLTFYCNDEDIFWSGSLQPKKGANDKHIKSHMHTKAHIEHLLFFFFSNSLTLSSV